MHIRAPVSSIFRPRRRPRPRTVREMLLDPRPVAGGEVSDLDKLRSIDELLDYQKEVRERLTEINQEHAGLPLPDEARAEWDELTAEDKEIDARVKDLRARDAYIEGLSDSPANVERADEPVVDRSSSNGRFPVRNVYDLYEYRKASRSMDEEANLLRQGALKIVERAVFPHPDAKREVAQEHIERLLNTIDGGDEEYSDGVRGALARRIVATGSPIYRRAFGKAFLQQPLTSEEQRALSLTGASGGFAVPFTLDPTIIPTSNGSVNPWRVISRVIPITGDEWRGVSSAGVTASYKAEASEAGDNSPTLAQPTVSTERADAFVPFSVEIGGDWTGLQAEIARLINDAKDDLEAVKFAVGTGTNEPFGVLTGTTNTVNAAAGADAFTLANLYSLKSALPPRYRPRASFVADDAIYTRVRQFDTVGSPSMVWADSLQDERPPRLLGKPAYEASGMPDDATTGNKFLLYGDFSRFVIVERVGMNIELIPHLFGANRRPTGERGYFAWWRNGSKVVDANGFRALLGTA
jgi:HK97 family phage major capsid protein